MSMGPKHSRHHPYYTSEESKIEVRMNSDSEEESNSKPSPPEHGDFYCSLCDAHMNCSSIYEGHLKGKRHLKNARRGYSVQQKYEYCNDKPTIKKLLDEETRPIAGLEHLVENVHSNQPPTYLCFLCSANCRSSEWLIDHIMGLKHQQAFLRAHNIELPDGLPNTLLIPLVQEHISKYEQEHGRGNMSVRKVKESSGPSFSCIRNGNKEEISFDSKLIGRSPKSKSLPTFKSTPPLKMSKRSPSPKISKYCPPLKMSKRSPSPKISKYSPPPKMSKRSPSPKISRHSRSRNISRHSPPRYIRHSPSRSPPQHSSSPNSFRRRSPSPGYSGYFSSPSYPKHFQTSRLPRHSPSPPKSVRMKEQNVQSEWQKVSFLEEKQREYSDEDDKWRKIEHTIFCNQEPTWQRLSKSKSEPADNYSCSELFTDGRKNSSDLRAILDKKKSLGGISRACAHDPSEQMPFDETYPRNLHDKGYEEIFQNNNTTAVPTQNVQFAHSLDKFISHFKRRKTTRQENLSSHLISSEQYNQLNISPYKNTLERASSFKDHETVQQENDCLKDVQSCNLMLPELYNGDTVSPHHQLNSSPYENTSERTFFNSECSQRENSALPFSSINRDSTVIPGLTLIEESRTSDSATINEYTEDARDIFGNIKMPSKSSYENKD